MMATGNSRHGWGGERLILVATLAIHVAMVAWGASRHSPTVDEPAYLVSGLSHWEFGRFDLCKVSPPLVRLVAAVPLQFVGPRYDWNSYDPNSRMRQEQIVGLTFVVANEDRVFWLFTLARWACIPFTLIGACVSYFWSKELFGSYPAWAALFLWCFSPNIVAHAQLLTPDVGVAALCVAACYAFWKWSRTHTWINTLLAGVVLGTAVLAKTNALALYPAVMLAVSLQAVGGQQYRKKRAVLQFAVAILVSVYVINLCYGFEGSLQRVGDFRFVSRTLGGEPDDNRFRGTLIGRVPVPLPSAFVEGIDLQRRDFENLDGQMKTYLRGRWYDHGWWWYYFYVVAVKVPIGTWIVVSIGIAIVLFGKMRQSADCFCYLVIPGAALFILACSQTGIGHSLRYVLPAFPFAFVIGSGVAASGCFRRAVCAVAISWMLVSSLQVFPHSLSYFNEIVGGPRNGHFHLLDGNVEWGQDVLYVREWIDRHPEARPLRSAIWSYLPASVLGVKPEEAIGQFGDSVPAGWYVVSVNHLRGDYRLRQPELEKFLSLKPESRIAYTSYVYHIRR